MKAETMTAWEILRERAETGRDPIAYACWKLVDYGQATEAQAVATALEQYANDAERLKRQLLWHLERCSRPHAVMVGGELTITDAAFGPPEEE